jgi:radical SAM superfamily enzyme YgiQ (UPF0313 family)
MKFLLVRAGNRRKITNYILSAPSTEPPLGLLYIGAMLEKNGHSVEILDYYMEEVSKEKLSNSLLSSDAVGIMIYSNDFKEAENISRDIKEIDSDIPLIIGGPHCSYMQKKSLKDLTYADICVIGEGEKVILELIKYLNGSKKLSDIAGICFRDNSSIISGKPVKVISNLDDLPFPARHLVEKYEYGKFSFGYELRKLVTSMNTSRGCPFHCRFCNRYGNIIDGWGYRQRSVENVLKEFSVIDKKYQTISIVDDNFLADKNRAEKIFDGLIEMNRDIDIMIRGARVDSANKGLYQKMKKAGVRYLFFGLESGNQDVLDFYNKNVSLNQIKNAVRLSNKMGFYTVASFILGAPIETRNHIENTIKFACSLPLDVVGFGPLSYYRGSELWKEAVDNNILSEDSFSVFADSNKGLGNFTREELKRYSNHAFQRFYFRPSYFISQVYRGLKRNDISTCFYGLRLLFKEKKIRSLS